MGSSVLCVPDAVQRERQRSGAPLIRDRHGPKRSRVCSASQRNQVYADCVNLSALLRCARDTRVGDALAASCEEPTFTCGRIRSIVSGLLFTMKTATRTCEPSARDIVRARDLHAIFELDDVRARDLLDNGPLERMGPPAMGPAHGPATN